MEKCPAPLKPAFHINVYSEPGIGTSFRLYLPRSHANFEVVPPSRVAETVSGHGETVLAVEDNASLRRIAVKQLRDLNYRVVAAEDAAGALSALEREPIDLLFTDVIMPGGRSGLELARITLTRWPEVRVILTSGFTDANLVEDTVTLSNVQLLSKPYRKEDLGRALQAAFAT